MKILSSLVGILLTVNVVAQPVVDLVIYTTEPNPFFLILNGVKQNDVAMTNVRVTDLNQPTYDVRVVFESDNVQIDKKIFFADPGMEYVYKVKEKRNGDLTLRMQSATALNLAPPPPANQQAIVYHATPNPIPVPVPVAVQETVTTTTTTSTVTQSNSINNGGGVNMSLGIPGMNINMNVNDPFLSTPQGGSTSYTESITTTTTSAPGLVEPAYQPDHYVMPGYNGPIGCPWPMTNDQFSDALRSISARSFDDEKATVAKQITGSNCLTVNQAKTIMMELTFDSAKLDYAKFAYNKTYDIGNYYMLNDAFDFSSSVDELNQHINGY